MWFSMSTGGASPVTALRAFRLVEAREEPVRQRAGDSAPSLTPPGACAGERALRVWTFREMRRGR